MVYAAYGSNMDTEQMIHRCPKAELVGVAMLKNWKLTFKMSATDSYATIIQAKKYKVPVVLWWIDEIDERTLDRYEGVPTCYYKTYLPLSQVRVLDTGYKKPTHAMVYILPDERQTQAPSINYIHKLLDAYYEFGFDERILEESYQEAVKAHFHNPYVKSYTYLL